MNPEPEQSLAEGLANNTQQDIPWGFGAWAQAFGMYDDLDKVRVVTNVSAGTDGDWGSQCQLPNGSVYGAATVRSGSCCLQPCLFLECLDTRCAHTLVHS